LSNQIITPKLTVDIIIRMNENCDQIILIKRKFPPEGWALPGGFVDLGETVEQAAQREAKEETSLNVTLLRQFHVYSEPARDWRGHTVSVIFVANANGTPCAQDDAAQIGIFTPEELPAMIAFDHRQILTDYFQGRY
jgi:8-oxo-dGTP diphosphatase